MKKLFLNAFGLAIFIAGLSATAIFAQTPIRGEATNFGMQTVSPGQSIRLTVVNPRPLSARELEPCLRVRIVIDVYANASGDGPRLRFVRRIERTFELEAGEAASYDFSAIRLGGERVSVSVFAVPEEGTFPADEPPSAQNTLEIRQGERTLFNAPGVLKGFNPQPEPPV